MGDNIFRQAKELLDKKDNGAELTEEEHALIATAGIPLDVNTGFFPKDITTDEGLEALARMLEEAKGQ